MNDNQLAGEFKVLDKENRDQILSYIAYHKPSAKLQILDEKPLSELTHIEALNLLLQDHRVREIALAKMKYFYTKYTIEGEDLDEVTENEMKNCW